jgi:hypothetical protein
VEEQFNAMCVSLLNLMVSVGLMNSVMGQYPEEVQEAWGERMSEYEQWADRQTMEIQLYAEHWDNPIDDSDPEDQ